MYKFISLLTLAATALALPAELAPIEARSDIFNPNDAFCPDGLLFTSFQCCTTRVLGGVVSLDCEIRELKPKPPLPLPSDMIASYIHQPPTRS
jgi:hypothetical protein